MNREKWIVRSFDIRQLVLTEKYDAVFCSSEGELYAYQLDGMAVAQVVTTEYSCSGRDKSGYPLNRQSRVIATEHQIVGVSLGESGWNVCEESINFSGYVRHGEDPNMTESATSHLQGEYYEKRRSAKSTSDDKPVD